MKALITGASSGIGEALADLLASKGILLILAGRDQERLEAVAKRNSAEKIIIADLGHPEGRKKIIDIMKEESFDLLINNAGFGIYGEAIATAVREQLAILTVNATAVLELTLEAAQSFVKKNKKGVIVNVSSVAGEIPTPGMSVYGASKSFVTMLSQSLDWELKPKGVRVLVSCPGMVATRFSSRAAKKNVSSSKRLTMSKEFAAEEIWKQIENKQKKRIFGRYNLIFSFFTRYFVPDWIISRVIWNRIKERL